MAFEPGGFKLAVGHLAGHDDLKGALAEVEAGRLKCLPSKSR